MADAPQMLRLPDGRQLAWYEYGDAAGLPCIYTTGTPASGLAGKTFDKAAAEAGVRWISVDKPRYGHSDLQPGRSLLQWPDDVRVLADHLEFDRFAVVGESGGGPHALALAYGLPDRITTATARRVAAALADCDARFYPDLGHFLAIPRRREVLDCVVAAA